MIIQELDETFKSNETFYKLNQRALLLESKLSDTTSEYPSVILSRINQLFEVYKQNSKNPQMKSQLFILEVALQELCLVLEKVQKNSN